MAVIQKGIAVAWGTGGSGTMTYAGTAFRVKATGVDLSKDAELEEHRDPQTGDVIGLTFFNPTKEVSLKVYPTDTAMSTAATVVLPEIGDAFNIGAGLTYAIDADISPGLTNAATNNYIVMKCSKARVNNGRTNFDVTVKRYNTDLSATISS